MRIAVWGTKHEIARTVADAVLEGLGDKAYIYLDTDEMFCEEADVHIGYGILRGMDRMFKACDKAGKPWFNIDRGYWKPGHYDGYYRISLNGTQQTTGLSKLEPTYERWEQLGLEILPGRPIEDGPELYKRHPKLFCPPTDAVCQFFSIDQWQKPTHGVLLDYWRTKDSQDDLQTQLSKCKQVDTFNSSIGWEALRQGIPVISDPNHSFIGAYQNQVDTMSRLDVDKRHRMFAVMASLQLSLEEIRQGKLWPLLNNLLLV